MSNTRVKDFIREIKKNKGRFLSIFFIVLLGAAFFSGIRSSGGDMKYTADYYFDETDMMDIEVISTLGLTDEDLEDIQKIDGVESAFGGYSMDVLNNNGKDESAVKLIGYTDDINKFTLSQGRMPEKQDECLVDDFYMDLMGYEIGDTISFYSGTDTELSESLKVTEFTIVGSGGLPYYIDLTRGTGTVGNGQLEGYICIDPAVFDMDIYTEIYVKIAGAKELNSYSDQYKDLVENVTDKVEELGESASERRYNEIVDEANEQIEDGNQQIEDAEQELEDAKKELDDGKKELDDAKKELDDGKVELEDGKKELEDAEAEIKSGEAELADALAQIQENEAKLADAKAELDAAKVELDSGAVEIANGKAQIAENEELLNQKTAELQAGWEQYNQAMALINPDNLSFEDLNARLNEQLQELNTQKEQLNTQKGQLNTQLEAVENMLAADPDNQQLLAYKAQIEAGIKQVDDGIKQVEGYIGQIGSAVSQIPVLQETKNQLTAGQAQIDAGWTEIANAKETLAANEQQFNAGVAEYNSGLAQYEDGLRQLNEGKAEYEEGLKEFNEGKAEYEEGKAEYESALEDYNEGLKEYEDGLKEWTDGNEEFNEKSADAQEEIEKGRLDIQDAEDELAKLQKPKWHVLDREMMQSVASYGSDADRIDSLGNVFPVLFFLVAVLVSLTCMTRMVEEQRQQIGTFKALGYSGLQIAAKYIGYALLATVAGAVIGVLLGEKFLPAVVLSSYGMLYTGIPYYFVPYNWAQGILAIVLSVACTGGATLAATLKQLKEKPAELMRPEAPKIGKRILLERVSFIWKKLNFTQKSTLRNLFRYKKRFIMTIIGIGGCMSLMLVGFGLRDSITVVAQNQFREIFKHDAAIAIDAEADEQEIRTLEGEIKNYSGVEDYMELCQASVTLKANGIDRSAFIYVPEETDNVFDFVRFRDRVTKQTYDYPENGVALSEKTADMLDVSVGDSIIIEDADGIDSKEVKVEEIVENYVQHYAFMTAETYTEIFGEEPEYNYFYVKYDNQTEEYEKAFSTYMLENDACAGVSLTSDLENQIEDMLDTLNLVIWVLIISAALLACVVLYNLNSINITERRRELATLKVLGFNNMEVAMYIYRENIILTLIGIAAGAVLGTFLHLFTISTVEVDMMMFGRNIGVTSYLICAALTAVFSILVNLVMYSHFKKIDMVESLKSVE
jgi:putative ABC transport system permease protein